MHNSLPSTRAREESQHPQNQQHEAVDDIGKTNHNKLRTSFGGWGEGRKGGIGVEGGRGRSEWGEGGRCKQAQGRGIGDIDVSSRCHADLYHRLQLETAVAMVYNGTSSAPQRIMLPGRSASVDHRNLGLELKSEVTNMSPPAP